MYLCAKIFLKNKDEVTYDSMLQLLKSESFVHGYLLFMVIIHASLRIKLYENSKINIKSIQRCRFSVQVLKTK
jgi:hypothetical protein